MCAVRGKKCRMVFRSGMKNTGAGDGNPQNDSKIKNNKVTIKGVSKNYLVEVEFVEVDD